MAISVTILSFSSITTAALFYILYKETISLLQFFAMILVLCCPIFIALAQKVDSSDLSLQQATTSSLVPVSIAIAMCFMFTLVSFLSRTASDNNYKAIPFTIDANGVYGFVLMIPFFIANYYYPYSFEEIAITSVAAILSTLGVISLFTAINNWKAGLSSALVQTAAIVMLVLEIIFMGKNPSPMQVAGMVVGIVGVVIISVGHK